MAAKDILNRLSKTAGLIPGLDRTQRQLGGMALGLGAGVGLVGSQFAQRYRDAANAPTADQREAANFYERAAERGLARRQLKLDNTVDEAEALAGQGTTTPVAENTPAAPKAEEGAAAPVAPAGPESASTPEVDEPKFKPTSYDVGVPKNWYDYDHPLMIAGLGLGAAGLGYGGYKLYQYLNQPKEEEKKTAAAKKKKEEEEEAPLGDSVFPKMFPWQAANVGAGLGAAGLGAGAYAAGSLLPTLPKQLAGIDPKAMQADTAERAGQWFNDFQRQTEPYIARFSGKEVGQSVLGTAREQFLKALAKAQESSAQSTASKTIQNVYNPLVEFYNKNMPTLQNASPLMQAAGLGLGGLGTAYGLYHGYRMLNPPAKKHKSLLELAAEDVG